MLTCIWVSFVVGGGLALARQSLCAPPAPEPVQDSDVADFVKNSR